MFVSIARNYLDARDSSGHILNLRKETSLKYKIINYLNSLVDKAPSVLDDRFRHIFKYSTILNFSEKGNYLRIDSENIEKARLITENFEKKLKENKIPYPLENGERGEYEEKLFDPNPLWE